MTDNSKNLAIGRIKSDLRYINAVDLADIITDRSAPETYDLEFAKEVHRSIENHLNRLLKNWKNTNETE
tara:strand:+ start:1512 stop:1718 length:207 start_codon:yes stop_codon:yes gene_type:complete